MGMFDLKGGTMIPWEYNGKKYNGVVQIAVGIDGCWEYVSIVNGWNSPPPIASFGYAVDRWTNCQECGSSERHSEWHSDRYKLVKAEQVHNGLWFAYYEKEETQ